MVGIGGIQSHGQSRDGRWLVGMGVAAATRGNPIELSKANVRLGPDGVAVVRMAMTDIGTGTYTILTQIAAEMLGLPPERIRVELGDTNFPYASGSGGSFGAASSGSALFDACNNLRARLAGLAGVDPDKARVADGQIEAAGQSTPLIGLVGPEGIDAGRRTGHLRRRRLDRQRDLQCLRRACPRLPDNPGQVDFRTTDCKHDTSLRPIVGGTSVDPGLCGCAFSRSVTKRRNHPTRAPTCARPAELGCS